MNESNPGQKLIAGLRRPDMGQTLFEGGPAARGVYEGLRDRIVRLELPPGTALLRNELAKTYGVSLTPLRDALQQLAKEKLVRIYPQSRTLVTRIDIGAIREAQFMRLALETEVVRELARHHDPADLDHLRNILALQASVGQPPSDIAMFQELDEIFHQSLFAAAGHGPSQRLMRGQAGDLERLRRLHLEDETAEGQNGVQAVLAGHRGILDGIAAGDASAAGQALRDHLTRTYDRIAEKRGAFPDYFAPEPAR